MQRSWMSGFVLALATSALGVNAAEGPAHQSIDSLSAAVREQVVADLGPEVSVTLDRLDPRLRLPRCEQALSVLATGKPISLGQNTLAVRCEDPRPWAVYVGARVGQRVAVLVARHPLALGARINAADVDLVERDATNLRAGSFNDPEAVIGKVVSRPLATGALLTQQHVQAMQVVRRGQAVVIRLRGRGLQVDAAGKALADGAPGDRIRVENRHSRRVIEGVIDAEGVINVAI